MATTRPYLYYDAAVSVCTTCLRKIDAKIVFQDDRVWMLKHCLTHGSERVLLSDDVAYYRQCREVYIKPPEICTTSASPSFAMIESSIASTTSSERCVCLSGPLFA